MPEIDIFNEAPQIKGEFFKFNKPGDAVKGTYVDSYDGVDGYDNEQLIVVLRNQADHSIYHKVGIKKTSSVLMKQMQPIKYGQIIGFRFDEERPSKARPGSKAKIINVFHDPKIVDKEWLESEVAREAKYQEGYTPEQVDVQPTAVESVTTPTPEDNPILNTIRDLAVSKGIATVEMGPTERDAKILAATGIALTTETASDVLMKISTL